MAELVTFLIANTKRMADEQANEGYDAYQTALQANEGYDAYQTALQAYRKQLKALIIQKMKETTTGYITIADDCHPQQRAIIADILTKEVGDRFSFHVGNHRYYILDPNFVQPNAPCKD